MAETITICGITDLMPLPALKLENIDHDITKQLAPIVIEVPNFKYQGISSDIELPGGGTISNSCSSATSFILGV